MADDPFDDWERTPARKAEEQVEYQKLAWYAAPFSDAGVALIVLAVAIKLLRRLGRQVIRIAARLKLV
jgi:small neutral amino acid transporter SnatA (MarC family)